MPNSHDVLIIGAGIFGVTAALELATRGAQVAVLDPGPIPHPLAASTDISKVVRMEYGPDEDYMALVEAALPGWHKWNDIMPEPLYHETGVNMVTKEPMSSGGFEYDSYQSLIKRGHNPQRLAADDITLRFPAWKPGTYVDGFYHSKGGFAESGRIVSALVKMGQQQAVTYYPEQAVQKIITDSETATGILTRDGTKFNAETIIVAAGAWTPTLVPELAPMMQITGHPVFHLLPSNPNLFTPPNFSVFTADVARTGWYGFSLHPNEKVIKIANHGVGQRLHPETDKRIVTDSDTQNLRTFLQETFPTLVDAPIVYTRRCLYCDTLDEHLWIDYHPTIKGLFIASGGSGHGFKFAPMLGSIIADAVERKSNPWTSKFKWRDLNPQTRGKEAARHHG